MSKHEIPKAAVEAAACAMYEHDVLTWDDGTDPDWECEGDSQQENYRSAARAALGAAAPHMHRATPTVTERDEMAEVIWGVEAEDFGGYKTSVTSKAADQIAAALLAAGYRKVTE